MQEAPELPITIKQWLSNEKNFNYRFTRLSG